MVQKWFSRLLVVGAILTSSLVYAKDIKFGATSGPYADMVKYAIAPYLKTKGYNVKIVEFNDYIQPNKALADGSLDANLFQHSIYLNNFAKNHQLDLSALVHVPTAPMGLYSKRFQSLNDLKDGARIAVPNDATNMARALYMLQELGWGQLKPSFNPLTASEKDITPTKAQFKIIPLEAGQLPRSLDDVDFSFVPGNFALSSGMQLTSALLLEKTSLDYVNVIAVRTADKDSALANDLRAAVASQDFANVIKEKFAGFYLPAK